MADPVNFLSKGSIGGHKLRSLTDVGLPAAFVQNTAYVSNKPLKTGTPSTVMYSLLLSAGNGTLEIKKGATQAAAEDFTGGVAESVTVATNVRTTVCVDTDAANPYVAVKFTDGNNVGGSTAAESFMLGLVDLKAGEVAVTLETAVNAVAAAADGALSRVPA